MTRNIRLLAITDNFDLANLIRAVFREFKIDKPGTVYTDPTTDDLFNVFKNEKSVYWVAEENGKLAGGCGVYPTPGLPPSYAELVKFYLLAEYRGLGIGKKLLEKCFASAMEKGYTHLYLESFPELETAVGMYEKAGFKSIDHPLGNSGHYACTIWMVKELKSEE